MYIIGYDIGSSSIKASLIQIDNQNVLGVVQFPDREMNIISKQKGWAEQDPEMWWKNLGFATRNLLQTYNINPEEIKGIGVAYQMHGLVLVDRDFQVLRPAIIWCDSRAVSIGDRAFHDIGEQYCLDNLLNSPGNFTASKLKWVSDNEPELYRKVHKILLPGDFIAMKLTGIVSTTISGLSEGIFWNFRKKKIDDKLLDYFSIDESVLPDVSETFSEVGRVTKIAAEKTGLAVGTPVTYRMGDQPNNAVSLNVLHQGQVAGSGGTSGVLYGVADKPIYDEQQRVNAFAHVNYDSNCDRIGTLLCINGAGIQYSWIKKEIALAKTSYVDLEQMVSAIPEGSEGVCVLPFGNGSERIFSNRDIGSHICNLDFNRHTRAHLFRASLEGVAFAFVYGMNVLKDLGMEVDVLRVGNDNLFQSKVFSTTISTLLGIPIEVVYTTGATGAARAAGVGCGIYSTLEEALSSIVPANVFEPGHNYEMCSKAYGHWLDSLNSILQASPDVFAKTKNLRTQSSKAKNKLKRIQIDSKGTGVISQTGSPGNLIDSKSASKGAVELLNERFEFLNDDFVQRLGKKYPSLTYEEMKLCALIKLKMSTRDLARHLNLSTRGIETKRYRLRKKLEIPSSTNLVKFISSV